MRKRTRRQRGGVFYNGRLELYKWYMEHVSLQPQSPLTMRIYFLPTVFNCDPTDGYNKIYEINDHPRLIYKRLEKSSSLSGKGAFQMNIQHSEILYSYVLSHLVFTGNFPHFPLFFLAKECTKEWRLIYEKSDGDGKKWIDSIQMNVEPWVTRNSYNESVLKSRYISMILQLGLTVIKTRSLGISLSDIKPENFLFITMDDATPTNLVFFHYQYAHDGVIHNIYVRCVGDLWLRTDFGYESTGSGIPYPNQIVKMITMFDEDIRYSNPAVTNLSFLASSHKLLRMQQIYHQNMHMDPPTQQNILKGMKKERTYSHNNKAFYALRNIRVDNEGLFQTLMQLLMNATQDISQLSHLQEQLTAQAGSDTIWKAAFIYDPKHPPERIINPVPFQLTSTPFPIDFTQAGFDEIKGNAII